MRKFIATVFIIYYSNCFFAQTETKAISVFTNYHPTDFFIGFEYFQKRNLNLCSGIQFGINRTIFQQRIYPKFHISIGKDFELSKKIGIQASLRNSNSFLNVSSPGKKAVVFTEEPTLGLGIYFGNRFKCIPSLYWGYTFYWRNTISSTNNWSKQQFFSPEIKFTYAF